jgi:hypothetical protein
VVETLSDRVSNAVEAEGAAPTRGSRPGRAKALKSAHFGRSGARESICWVDIPLGDLINHYIEMY